MYRTVYKFLLQSYGKAPGYWVCLVSSLLQTLLLRVFAIVVIAQMAGHISSGDTKLAKSDAFHYLAIAVAGLALRVIKEVVGVHSENITYAKLMTRYYKRLVGKDMAFFRDNQTGYLATSFRQHVDSAIDLARLLRGDLMQLPIILIVPTIILFNASKLVGITTASVVLVQIIYISWASKVINTYRAAAHEIYRKISGQVSDDITNIIAFKTSGLVESQIRYLSRLISEETRIFWKRRSVGAYLDAPRELITVTGTALAFIVIASHIGSTTVSVSVVVITVTYMFQLFSVVSTIPELMIRHDELVTKLYSTLEYMGDSYQSIQDPRHPKQLKKPVGTLDITDMTFAYTAIGHPKNVFSSFELHVRAGEQVGIVGLSGAGKSTLASLIMRFDEVCEGSIAIDGVDIRDLRQDDLHQLIAYVPQEPLLFHRSIRENIAYFRPDASQADIVRAAKAAHAHDFIQDLSSGYDTLVGERGIKLSGGQKQRIAIARAVLKNAPIMLFDEATSALDSESERIIQAALPTIIGKKTALVIAHRLSTIAGLDRIIVMHDGTIEEQGTHAELLALKGRYHSLWQKQTTHS